ncbi:hypothetical protein [Streptomyces sp. NPDC047869]|uniref:hypothetical protein n=1 Tax=Streptomyces sp. NPDC047869 TaxID=3154709 RepID=UPI00345588D5
MSGDDAAGGPTVGTSRNLERRTLLKAAGASAAALGLAATTGCGGGSGSGDGTVTIRYSWWGAEERAKKISRTIALFEKKYPKIKVKTDFQTYQSFWEKFQTQAAGGNPRTFSKTPSRFFGSTTSAEFSSTSSPRCGKGT